jgi:hypothetical protein
MIRASETRVLSVYSRPVRHEIGSLFGKEMHRFTIDAGLSSQYVTQWSDNENILFRDVLKRIGGKLRIV